MKRITMQLDDEIYTNLRNHVPHGFRRHVLGSIIKLTVDAIKRDGVSMIAAVIADEYKLVRDEQRKTGK